jgi:hypothetical protein
LIEELARRAVVVIRRATRKLKRRQVLAKLNALDGEAAKRAFTEFLEGRRLNADQLEFLDLIIDHLTARGVMDPSLLYESPVHRLR